MSFHDVMWYNFLTKYKRDKVLLNDILFKLVYNEIAWKKSMRT